jgi:hypothetical protein
MTKPYERPEGIDGVAWPAITVIIAAVIEYARIAAGENRSSVITVSLDNKQAVRKATLMKFRVYLAGAA